MRLLTVALMASLAVAPGAAAKDSEAAYKTVEAKHFTRVEGVELSLAFTDYLYAELRNELTKTKLFVQVIGEGEAVEDADAAKSMVIEGALEDAVRNFLRGTQLREAVASLMKNNPSAPVAAASGGVAFAQGDGSSGHNFKFKFEER